MLFPDLITDSVTYKALYTGEPWGNEDCFPVLQLGAVYWWKRRIKGFHGACVWECGFSLSSHITPTLGTSSFLYNFAHAVPSAWNSLYVLVHPAGELMPQDLNVIHSTKPFSTFPNSMTAGIKKWAWAYKISKLSRNIINMHTWWHF